MILESSKINVLFDGKRIKVEGSNLLKNKLCGLCGDSNNKMIGDVPSPRQCLLSSPKLEVASYRVSLPSKQCSPLPGSIKAELEKESEMCVKLSNHRTTGRYSSSSIGSSISGSEVSDLSPWPPGMNNCSNPVLGFNCTGVPYDPVCAHL